MSYQKKVVSTNRGSYSYLSVGDKENPVIIILHGVSGSANDFVGIATALSVKGYQVILPNLPGHMDSDYVDAQDFTDLARWLHEFVESLNLKSPPSALVGNSLAAAVCYEYSSIYTLAPETKVFLVVPTPFVTKLVKLFQDILVVLPQKLVKHSYNKPALNHLRVNYALVSKDPMIRKRVFESEQRKEFLDVRILRYPVLLEKSNPFQRIKLDEETQKKVVLLCGAQDNVAGKRSLSVLRKLLPHSKMVVVPRTGHIMHFEAEADYIRHLYTETAERNI